MAMMLKTLFVLLVAFTLNACNYHLRGTQEVPTVLKHIYMNSASTQLEDSFRDALEAVGGELIKQPSQNGVIINILSEQFDRRSLSLSSTGKASEFELIYNLRFETLSFDNKVLMPNQAVEIKRNYFNDQQDIIGKGNEEATLRQEMYREAVKAMVDRGRALLKAANK